QGQVTTIDRHTVVGLDIEAFGDLAWTITIVPADFGEVCSGTDTLHARTTVEGDPPDQGMGTVGQRTTVGWHGAAVRRNAEHGISDFVCCCQEAQLFLSLDVEVVNDQLDGAVSGEALGLPDGSQTPYCRFFRLDVSHCHRLGTTPGTASHCVAVGVVDDLARNDVGSRRLIVGAKRTTEGQV